MTSAIKTAAQWQKELSLMEAHPIEDVRDDVLSVIRNSGMSFKNIQERGGPVTGTLYAWEDRKVRRPQFDSLRRAVQACGYDFAIVLKGGR